MSHFCCVLLGLAIGFSLNARILRDLQAACNQKGLIYAPYLQSAPEGSNHCVPGGK